jgi:toxin-antitoxin system PIN domain toxin
LIVPDVNLLLYAHVTGFAEHAKARRWWEALMNGDQEVGLGAPALFGFVRLATNAQVFDRPLSVDVALRHVEQWLSRPHVRFVVPGPDHLDTAFTLLRALGAAGNLTTDAQLAALAIEHQGEVHSNDADFARFPSLRWVNPLR